MQPIGRWVVNKSHQVYIVAVGHTHLRTGYMVLMLALAQTARAADFEPSPTAGLVGGAIVTPQSNPLGSGITIVPRVGVQVSPRTDLELNAGWSQGLTRIVGRRYSIFNPRGNVLVHVTPDHVADFFVAGGLGIQFVNVNRQFEGIEVNDTNRGLYKLPSSDFVLNVGPGVTFHLNQWLHVRTDLRWYATFGGEPTQDRSDVHAGNFEWTLGLDFRKETEGDIDTDGDGRMDSEDRCIETKEDYDGFEDRDGCPEWDNDGDGIADEDDDCPNEPEDEDGYQDHDGCPEMESPDSDGDGITDEFDACPNQPETDNDYEDSDGCPDEIPVEVQAFTGTIDGITFELNSAVIRLSSTAVLQEAWDVLTDYESVKLLIEGHTDDTGSDEYNLELSHKRAESVANWFVEHGIAPERLQYQGFGENRPIAGNDTEAGRSENRRVEFTLVD